MNGNELAGKSVFVGWRASLHRIIYEADTPAGKLFDALLISSILLSVLCVMLDSVAWISVEYAGALYAADTSRAPGLRTLDLGGDVARTLAVLNDPDVLTWTDVARAPAGDAPM